MHPLRLWCARNRLTLAVPFVACLMLMAQPVAAAGDPQSSVDSAAAQLHAAEAQAGAADSALASARAMLASAAAQLESLQTRIHALDATIATDTAKVQRLEAQLASDRAHLSAYLRQSYEHGGSTAALLYLISASSIADAIERTVQLDHVATASKALVDSIDSEASQAAATLADDHRARVQLSTLEAQAATQEAVVAVQEEQVASADNAAHQQVAKAKGVLSAAQAALAAARAKGTIYPPIPGVTFTVDTDLTQPSGETAARIDAFLQGTAMAGLGQSFMNAEQHSHVSARYFVAHAILESDWGASAIAQDKHNLFGFNADDANPYVDATTFPNFDACIQQVAAFVATDYLSPSGRFYHGPTLRGMNVDYASDPNWAYKIATIARTIP
jgi:beta-N-acetylglucosaminidase